LKEIEFKLTPKEPQNLSFCFKIKNVRTRIGGSLSKKMKNYTTLVGTPPSKIFIYLFILNPLSHSKEKDGPSWVHDKPPHWLHGNSIPKTKLFVTIFLLG